MAATAKAVPDEAIRWWETFSKGFTGDQGEEEVDSDFESVAEGERNAGDGQTAAAAHARVAREGSSARHGQGCRSDAEEEEVPGGCHVQLQGKLLLGSKRKAAATRAEPPAAGAEIQDEKGHGIDAEGYYTQFGGALLQVRKREATMTVETPGKLQTTTGTEIHDKKQSGYKKDQQVVAEEENVGMVVSESDGKMKAAAQAPVEEPSSSGIADHGCDEEQVPGDCYVQLQGGLLIGRKRKSTATHAEPQATRAEIQDKKDHEEVVSQNCYVQLQGRLLGRKWKATATQAESQTTRTEIQDKKGEYIPGDNYVQTGIGLQRRNRDATVTPKEVQTETGHGKRAQCECLRAENEMLRLQLMLKTKELESEQIQRLKLELDVKNKEIESLEKQNEELRAENERYRKTAMPPRSPRPFCKESVLDHRNCSGGAFPLLLDTITATTARSDLIR